MISLLVKSYAHSRMAATATFPGCHRGVLNYDRAFYWRWTREERGAMALASYEALPANRIASYDRQAFLTDLEYCRLHQAVQWLGWSPQWAPPPEHAQNWLKDALHSAEILGI